MARAATDETGEKVKKPKSEPSGSGKKKKAKSGNNRPSVSRRRSTINRVRMQNGVSRFMDAKAMDPEGVPTKTAYRKIMRSERRRNEANTEESEQRPKVNISGVSNKTLKQVGLDGYGS